MHVILILIAVIAGACIVALAMVVIGIRQVDRGQLDLPPATTMGRFARNITGLGYSRAPEPIRDDLTASRI